MKIEQPIVVLEHATEIGNQRIPVVLCHYPFEVWDQKHNGAVHLHGHTHGTLHPARNRLDVGVDMAFKIFREYRPFRLEEAVEIAVKETGNAE